MRWLALVSFAVLGLAADSSHAHARRGFAIIGSGDTISRRAALDDELGLEAREEFGFEEPALGYRYEYFSGS